ncbi:RCC1 domain-containing protein RUG3, mitochondrial isoform X2 [Amaranthus tricolor]|uniref:RCC1 domain-containing protein RUG3, mitochondrial isoform X2 n=1 Tax=Amaranthus tricolor TaxID=29722 RepID=UPI00258C0FF6|nr:RCC1 domain-containing protein RUG3, mitochondrial isoform X2 [Amaranthus tricolor]
MRISQLTHLLHIPTQQTSNAQSKMTNYSTLYHRLTTIRTFFSFKTTTKYPKPTTTTSINKPPILWKPTDSPSSSTISLQLLSWGRGSSGQLGNKTEQIHLYPTPIFSLLVPPSFQLCQSPGTISLPKVEKSTVEVGISCGLFHSAVLIDGKFWVWGKGDGGRLGLGHEDSVFVPKLNPYMIDVKALALVCRGYGGFGALGHTVFTRELVPRLVEGSWQEKIKHIATSGTHTAAITESGELYTWGREEGDGRLGLGPGRGPDQTGGLSVPCKVKALPVPVASVACGGFFTMVLTEEGKLWTWGANSNHELGTGDKVGGWKPRLISSLEDVRLVQIACGGYHSLALTEDGKVLSWGHGGHGQLGHYSNQNQKVPTVIEALADERVISIACGGSSSAAITETGKLYMWGNAKDSQLGVPGLPEINPSPVEVNFLREDDGLGSHHVLSVAIGATHTMCLVSRSSSTE